MKKLFIAFLLVSMSINLYAQENKVLTLNEDTSLIEAKIYHDSGVIAQTGFYTTDGLLQGEWISYDAEGVKTAVANYNKGRKEGTWLFYTGDVLKEVTYKDSKILAVSTWNRDLGIMSN
ncbi:MAG: nicotinic acid mononucleotide adenyltransferase [Gilvibacter sp.]